MSSEQNRDKSSKTSTNSKRRPGQPTKYRKRYCQGIIDYCKDGGFICGYATKLGVHTDTLTEWRKVHPEFSAAYKIAKEANKTFLLKAVLKGGFGQIQNYQGSSLMFLLKAVHGLNEYGPQEVEDNELEFVE